MTQTVVFANLTDLPDFDAVLVNIENYGVIDATNTGKITATSGSVLGTLQNAGDWLNSQKVFILGAGPATAVGTPTGLTITSEGPTGSTEYDYAVAAVDALGGMSAMTALASTTNGNATLGDINDLKAPAQYNQIAWSAGSGADPAGYVIYAKRSGVWVPIGMSLTTSWQDYGSPNNHDQTIPAWVLNPGPTSPVRQFLKTTILLGAGTTSIQLENPVQASVTQATMVHDSTDALIAAFAAGGALGVPEQTYAFTSGLTSSKPTILRGVGQGLSVLQGWGVFDMITFQDTQCGLAEMTLDASNMGGRFAVRYTGNRATHSHFRNLDIIGQYNTVSIDNGAGTSFWDHVNIDCPRGEHDVYLYSATDNQCTANYFSYWRQGSAGAAPNYSIGFEVSGNVQTVNVYLYGIITRMKTMVSYNNNVSAALGPALTRVEGMGFNFSQTTALDLNTLAGGQFINNYIQGNGGNASDGVVVGTAATRIKMLANDIFSFGGNGISMKGVGLDVEACNISGNTNAAIETFSGSVGTIINGGGSIDLIGTTSTGLNSGGNYGLKFDSGSLGIVVDGGRWQGNIANIDNSANIPDIRIYGQVCPPATSINNAPGNAALTVAAFPYLYKGLAGQFSTLEASGFGSGTPTYTFDTAAAIVTALKTYLNSAAVFVGLQFRIRIINHQNSQITIAGGTGTTITGSANVLASGGTNMTNYRMFIGTVTNIGSGTETVSIHGNSQ